MRGGARRGATVAPVLNLSFSRVRSPFRSQQSDNQRLIECVRRCKRPLPLSIKEPNRKGFRHLGPLVRIQFTEGVDTQFTLYTTNLDGITFTNLSAIPEPAAAAGLCGIVALAFVAIRRRRMGFN